MVWSKNAPHSSELRKGRNSIPNHAYFITKCTTPTLAPLLTRPDFAKIVVDSLLWARDSNWWRILGFVVMPGHYHLTMGLGEVKTLSDAMESVDRFISNKINKILGRKGSFWEEGFYDHAIRDRLDFDEILAYIHLNPVVAGLADNQEAWPYSTANEVYASEVDWEWLGVSLPKEVLTKQRFNPESVPSKYR